MNAPGRTVGTSLPDISDEQISEILSHLFAEGSAELTYSLPIPGLSVPGISDFYGIHLAIWQIREADLQKLFPLRTQSQRARYLAWCVVHGQHEYAALRELQPFWNQLAQPAVLQSTAWSGGISRRLQLILLGRPDLPIDHELGDAHAQEQALAWYFIKGGHQDAGDDAQASPAWQRAFFIDTPNLAHSNFAKLLIRSRDDIKAAFDLQTDQGQRELTQWLISHGLQETGLGTLIKPVRKSWPEAVNSSGDKKFGVNLMGYAYGELGIGEDVRMAARALQAAGVPFVIINIEPGSNVRQHDRSLEQWVSHEPRYMFNIICLTALEHLRVYLEKGRRFFTGKYNIGYWPWELHAWPKKWRHCFTLVDEMWASSQHIVRAAQGATAIPIAYMPMAVVSHQHNVDKVASRRALSLPESDTLFVFSFDGNSYTQRKNPSGIVEAFIKAFPPREDTVRLIIKCMRPDKNNPEWQRILSAASQDKRLIIIDQTMAKDEVLALYECCDCFISLHRAEGFGRGIAEALILGLEVIATGYGGNVEFCEAAQAHLIPYELVPLKANEYVEADGNFWAQPDLNAAAIAMQSVVLKKRSAAQTDPLQQKALLDALFSPTRVGDRYRIRLENLANQLLEQNSSSDEKDKLTNNQSTHHSEMNR